jgi:uncharacterized protein YceH (UPF0502 family)
MKLNTEKPNCFIYETEELLIELLGGVRIDTLDRMRVTIKVAVMNRKHAKYVGELSGLAVRHNLDLYNDTQVEKFIRRVAEKLEVGSIALTKAIAAITGELEVYRLTMLDKKEDKPVKKLTEQERKEALQFLQAKNLLQATNDMILILRRVSHQNTTTTTVRRRRLPGGGLCAARGCTEF